MATSIKIIPQNVTLEQKKKVAAYARVSSGKDAMLQSLSAQINYYSNMIQSRNDWLFAGVYADEAKSGTKENRPEFQRMLTDCKDGKINMIVTKSISRFARNTVTLLQTVRKLKDIGVAIFFEEQNINTLTADGELMLTILASYAQEESLSVSENQKWRIRNNFSKGKTCDGTIYGYRLDKGFYIIVPNEEIVVKRIFEEYLSGFGHLKIANRLNEDGIKSRFGGKWNSSVIRHMLSNFTYTGSLILQKTFRENHITKKKLINNGELPRYYAEDTHKAIIDKATFEQVQKETDKRRNKYYKPCNNKKYPFSGLLKCANCGKNYKRKTTASRVDWICSTYNKSGKKYCASKQIPEKTLIQVTKTVAPIDCIKYILISDNNIINFNLKDGTNVIKSWSNHLRKNSWTDEMKAEARIKSLERSKTYG